MTRTALVCFRNEDFETVAFILFLGKKFKTQAAEEPGKEFSRITLPSHFVYPPFLRSPYCTATLPVLLAGLLALHLLCLRGAGRQSRMVEWGINHSYPHRP
jgi:hypothetical protein